MKHIYAIAFLLIGTASAAQSNKLWGMTNLGGLHDDGTIFRVNLDGSGYEVVYSLSFGSAAYPWSSMILADDGKLYGTGIGDLFRFDPATNTFTTIAQVAVTEGLIQGADGLLYGGDAYSGDQSAGMIFSVDPLSGTEQELHSFNGDDGETPYGRLCQAGNGKLYGMTYGGGANGDGVLYEYDPVTDVYNNLLDFDGTNGNSPWSCLISIGADELLGSVTSGGPSGGGALFSLRPSTGEFELLHGFSGSVDGSLLFGGIIQASNGKVYGMTTLGGTSGAGTVYSYETTTGVVTTLHAFAGGAEGGSPNAELTEVGAQVSLPELATGTPGISVFPNPAEGETTVRLVGTSAGPRMLRLTDTTGRLIATERMTSLEQRITVPDQPGIYRLTLEDSGSLGSVPLIVR